MSKWFRTTHAWVGILATLFILILAITGLGLNHPSVLKQSPHNDNPFQNHPKKIFQLSDNKTLLLSSHSGVYQSVDQGKTLEKVSVPIPARNIVSLAESKKKIFLATASGLIVERKKDTHTWTRLLSPRGYDLHSIAWVSDTLLASTNEGLFAYKNDYWTQVQKNNSPLNIHTIIKALHTGYNPFSWIKWINSLATLGLIFLSLSGIYLFIKRLKP